MFRSNPLQNQRPELTDKFDRGEEKVRRLMSMGSTRSLRAGETLISEGEEHDFVYRLRKGWAGRARTLPDGRTQYILIFLPGDLFAVKSMFVRQHPDAIEALSDAVVEQVHQKELRKSFENDSEIALRCIWQVVEEERRLHSWVVGIGRGAVSERIAYLLLQFRFRLANCGAIERDALTFEVPMTQQQLADFLGISLVHLNKSLMKLREDGLISLRARTFTINDLASLGKVAHPLFDAFELSTQEFGGQRAATELQVVSR